MSSLALLAQAGSEVGSGRITGGWGYVYAAYIITGCTLALYSLSLFLRARKDRP